KTGREEDTDLKKLIKALQSEKVREFIKERYKGAIVTAF
ncbi:MAG: MetQ/NlpA family ABC transporter substrate-binding protein, partial [Fusobacteriaceae bacterium]